MKQRNDDSLETPMTPMIDVTFQLIIFFVVSAAQQKDLVDENVLLAQAKFVPAIERTEPKTITINVRSNGDVNIALQPLTLKQLNQILKATVARTGNNIPVVLRVDAKTLYRDVDKVMEVIGRSGLYRVRICAVAAK